MRQPLLGAELKGMIGGQAVRHGPGHVGERGAHGEKRPAVVDQARARHRLIQVVRGVKVTAQVADVGRLEQQGREQFVLDGQIELLGVPRLIVGVNADDAAARIVGQRQVEGRNNREAIAHAPRDEEVAGAEAVDRPERHVTLQA
jgi:hypothetical protein